MSVRHIGLVLDHLEATPPVKLVAIILADHADADGICWPSYHRIAERACLSERSVRRHIHDLVTAGVIRKVRTGGVVTRDGVRVWLTNQYRIDVAVLEAMPSVLKVVKDGHLDAKVVTGDHQEVVADGHPRWSEVATKPSEEPSQQTVMDVGIPDGAPLHLSSAVLEADFGEWWGASGRVGSMADARSLYVWWRTRGGASRDDLLAAIVNYREHCATTGEFQQHGRTFLVRPTKTQAARWPEWAAGEQHGSTDVAGSSRLRSVLSAGADIYDLGGEHGRSIDAAADPQPGPATRRGLPAGSVAG